MSTDEGNVKKINKLKQSLKKKGYEGLPQLFGVLIAIWGLSISLLANVVHDFFSKFPDFYTYYVIFVFLLYTSLAITIWYWLKKIYTDPVDKIKKEIEKLK